MTNTTDQYLYNSDQISAFMKKNNIKYNQTFKATVMYHSPKHDTEQDSCSNILISTNTWGIKVDIGTSDNHTIQPNTHHLDFSSNLQSYEMDVLDNSLIISGNSPKMGKYKVKILPEI